MINPETSADKKYTPSSVLFMCGMNSIRSPMAEALAKHLIAPGIYIQSAGVRAGDRDPFVDSVLDEVGLSLGKHKPRTMEELEDEYFDLIITLTPEAHHSALELTRYSTLDVVYWPMMDPTVASGTRDQILSAYREVREHLKKLICERLPTKVQSFSETR